MPELPEVETVRRTLQPVLGATIEKAWWSGKNLRLNKPLNWAGIRKASRDAEIESVRRLGKYLLLDLRGRPESLLVHLGMSGRLRHFSAKHPRPKHTHLEWQLTDGRTLRFSDPRRFGQVEIVVRGRERDNVSLARLGRDPLDEGITGAQLRAGCQRTRRPIKVALLDQGLVAGVGNIYASESLWQAGIHPATPANTLGLKRCDRLASAIVDVLTRALNHGGTSLKDFVSADGHQGEHAHYLWVYDQEGSACRRPLCRGKIVRSVQQNRASFHCPRCQRK